MENCKFCKDVPEEKKCGFCTEIINERLLNFELVAGSRLTGLFKSEVYLQDGQIILLTMNALGDTIFGLKRMINYCPICGRKLNAIK